MSLKNTHAPEIQSRRGRTLIAMLATTAAFIGSLIFAPTASAAFSTVGFVVTDTRAADDRALTLKFLGVEVRPGNFGFEETNTNGRPQLPVLGSTLPGPNSGQRFEMIAANQPNTNTGYALYGVYKSDGETLVNTFRVKMSVTRGHQTFGIPVRHASCGFCSIQYTPGTVYIDLEETP